MLVWQAIAQVRLFAQGQAIEIGIEEEVLYQEMLAAVRDR
jgi:hypothetical protein